MGPGRQVEAFSYLTLFLECEKKNCCLIVELRIPRGESSLFKKDLDGATWL